MEGSKHVTQINVADFPNRPATVSFQHAVNRPAKRRLAELKNAHVLSAFVLHDEKTHAARLNGGEHDLLEDADLTVRTWKVLASSPKPSWEPTGNLSIRDEWMVSELHVVYLPMQWLTNSDYSCIAEQ